MKIIVALDGSEGAEHAMERAFELARRVPDSVVHLVMVVEPIEGGWTALASFLPPQATSFPHDGISMSVPC